jgi:hypothetical protein
VANDAYRGTMTRRREGVCCHSRSLESRRPLPMHTAMHREPVDRVLCRPRWVRGRRAPWSKLLMGAASPHLDDHGVLPLGKAALLHGGVQVVPPSARMPGVRGIGRMLQQSLPDCWAPHRSLQLLPERPRTFSATTDHFCGPYMATSLRSCSSSCGKVHELARSCQCTLHAGRPRSQQHTSGVQAPFL